MTSRLEKLGLNDDQLIRALGVVGESVVKSNQEIAGAIHKVLEESRAEYLDTEEEVAKVKDEYEDKINQAVSLLTEGYTSINPETKNNCIKEVIVLFRGSMI